MRIETLLFVIVAISAVALVVQSLSMWKASRSIREKVGKLERRSVELEEDLRRLMTRIEGVVKSVEPLGRMAENVKANVDLISQMVKGRVQDFDQFGKEMLELGRDQASKFDYVVTDTVRKFEQTTELIQKDILRPAVEISSFFKGIKAGLSYLFNKKASTRPTESYPEEELFI
ncbi:hypothetical protein MYX75_12505 [Acidobacteria bacterium AH-259-A15]|nr:hypothetical protein [Acidobacteria bacterium AH-259-A15]